MTIFLVMMIVGMAGMLMMALPGLLGHGHGEVGGAHGTHDFHTEMHLPNAAPHISAGDIAAHGHGGQHHAGDGQAHNDAGIMRFIPSPRVVFSVMALWGAFGHITRETLHQTMPLAGGVGLLLALLVNHIAIRPLWNSLMKLNGVPSSPLEKLILQEAEAVTPFRNGRGIVAVDRDGRTVQFTATLPASEFGHQIKVGDRLQIEAVDAANERVTVTIK